MFISNKAAHGKFVPGKDCAALRARTVVTGKNTMAQKEPTWPLSRIKRSRISGVR
jgi:hypothetical protein